MSTAKTNADRLKEFHTAISGSIPTSPVLPDPETVALRETLITEEYKEVLEAFAQLKSAQSNGISSDITQLMHELADLLYVTYGTFADFGVDADAVFAEVHRANMAKLAGPRRADGKLLKPPGWQPADVAGIIAAQSEAP